MTASLPRSLAALPALLLIAGCATVPGQDRLAQKDPLEKFNRAMWGVNMTADKIIMKPVTQVYRAVAPKPARQGVHNFFSNVTEPWSFVNNILQGHVKRAGHNLKRFLVNTTIGIGGLFDHATKMGIEPAPEDLGQTMAVWGVNGGPYLVLPLLGPSTLRDGVGAGVAAYADPVGIAINHADVNVWYKRGFRAAGIIDARSELIESGGDAFLKSSLDPYAAARSAYLQRRRAQIANQEDSADAGPPDDDMALPPESTPPSEATPTPVADPSQAPSASTPAVSAPAPAAEAAAPPAPTPPPAEPTAPPKQ